MKYCLALFLVVAFGALFIHGLDLMLDGQKALGSAIAIMGLVLMLTWVPDLDRVPKLDGCEND